MMSTALASLTVLDLTRVRAGHPTCVRQFADWGASLIKIEMPEDGSLKVMRNPPGHK
jgi:crotonobetainyl-CoA:carnitine CoA-transferase CaiB-like acyl-CoA transferase